MPVLCYTPLDCNNSSPLFLTYTQSGPGHYDYAIPKPQNNNEVANKKSIKCTCGRKRDFKGKACSILRCVCLRSGQACSHMCTCKFCSNSYGTRPPPSSTRKRVPYAAQLQPLAGSTSKFISVIDEDLQLGHLTIFEDILLKFLVCYLIMNGIEVSEGSLYDMYQQILALAALCPSIIFPVFDRSSSDIRKFLKKLCVLLDYIKCFL